MGERTYVNKTGSPKQKGGLSRLSIDLPTLVIVASLLVIGLLMVYSTGLDASLNDNKPPNYVFSRQALWILSGIVFAVILSFIDYHIYERFIVWIMAGIITALILVLVLNNVRFNSSRSLLGGSVQPAEFAKLATILYLSFWLTKRRAELKDVHVGLIPLSVILGIIGGLIFIQPDISAAVTIIILGFLLFFLAGADWKQFLIATILGVVVGGLIVASTSTGGLRLEQYLNAFQDPMTGSTHIRRSFESIIKGGFFGVGLGKAETKYVSLPLPHSDSIFAVIAEETGLLGSFIVISLFVLLLWRGLSIGKRAPDQLGTVMSFGLVSWIVIEALMNIAVIVGLVPITGNALPFISYGGSSMTATMAAIGITMNIARQGAAKENTERSSSSAIVDMRGRDGRRSVSGHNRFGDPQN